MAQCHPDKRLFAQGKCRQCYDKSYYAKNKERNKGLRIRRQYSITPEKYDRMLQEQNGVCAICHQPESRTRKNIVTSLCVDHNHKTGKVRSLLCSRCNTGLGKFMDNPELLQAASNYLNNHA